MARVLVLNTGSSSLKWSVLDAQRETLEASGNTSWHDADPMHHTEEIRKALSQAPPVDAVGHRVVHGGRRFQQAVVIDGQVRAGIAELIPLAPLHNPAALAGIDAATAALPRIPQVAAFDTAFHATLPAAAARYALPAGWTERWGVRRFGFHGLSVQYAVQRARQLLGELPPRLVVCHLGAGCSVTAVADGRSVDTSMGFTPLEGLVMARRCGSIDPGLMLYLERTAGVGVDDLDRGLNEDAGWLGVSGLTADWRELEQAARDEHAGAVLACDVFMHSLVRTVGQMVAVLGGLDGLIFTGGIGEHSARVRAGIAERLAFCGLRLDARANAERQPDADVAQSDSHVRVLVVEAREDLTVLHEVRRLVWPDATP
ncbi:MAG: acetate/propionate family kinase [Chloroflexi bacterium]|nr:acetate/propionate family kinase [Chloroflexota bacterium]